MSKDTCPHLYRKATAVNYFANGGHCLFPLEHIECMACNKEWILHGSDGKAEVTPFPEAGKIIEKWASKADEEWKRQESKILIPDSKLIT